MRKTALKRAKSRMLHICLDVNRFDGTMPQQKQTRLHGRFSFLREFTALHYQTFFSGLRADLCVVP
jgi:hypothetical protein